MGYAEGLECFIWIKTFEKLNDPECGLYYQGPVYVFDFLKKEIETGKIA